MVDAAHERSGEVEIATSTLAEIYVQQGLVDRALVIYRRLAQRNPGDAQIAMRVAELETELERQRAGTEREALAEPPDLEGSSPTAYERASALEELAASERASDSEPPAGPDSAPPSEPPGGVPAASADRQFLDWLEKR